MRKYCASLVFLFASTLLVCAPCMYGGQNTWVKGQWTRWNIFYASHPSEHKAHDEAIQDMCQQVSDISDYEKESAIYLAACHQNEDLCDFLLQKYSQGHSSINLNRRYGSDLYPTVLSAVRKCSIAKKLVDAGAQVQGDEELLFNTILEGHGSENFYDLRENFHELVELYLAKGAPLVRADGRTIFHVLADFSLRERPVLPLAQIIGDKVSHNMFFELMNSNYRSITVAPGTTTGCLVDWLSDTTTGKSSSAKELKNYLRGKLSLDTKELSESGINFDDATNFDDAMNSVPGRGLLITIRNTIEKVALLYYQE